MYEELLLHNRTRGRLATPQLLRTCRQINDEAKGLLYVSSSLTIDAKFFISEDVFDGGREHAGWAFSEQDQQWREWYEMSDIDKEELEATGYAPPPSPRRNPLASIGGTSYYKPCLLTGDIQRRAEPLTLRQANELWPSTLCDIPTLNLNISLELDPLFATDESMDRSDFSGFNFLLYSLFSHLSSSSKKQKIIITLLNLAGVSDLEITYYGYPLLKMPPNISVVIDDTELSVEYRAGLVKNDKCLSVIKNDILKKGVENLDRLENLTHDDDTSENYPIEVIRQARNARNYLSKILETNNWGWVGDEDDLYYGKVNILVEEVLKQASSSKNGRQAWLARMRLRALVVDLETVVEDYWWTWDAPVHAPVIGTLCM